MNYTKGPWKVEEYHRHLKEAAGNDLCIFNSYREICRIKNPSSDWETSEANAHLIASSPILLTACLAALQYVSGPADIRMNDEEMENMLRHAIAQAKDVT